MYISNPILDQQKHDIDPLESPCFGQNPIFLQCPMMFKYVQHGYNGDYKNPIDSRSKNPMNSFSVDLPEIQSLNVTY